MSKRNKRVSHVPCRSFLRRLYFLSDKGSRSVGDLEEIVPLHSVNENESQVP